MKLLFPGTNLLFPLFFLLEIQGKLLLHPKGLGTFLVDASNLNITDYANF